MPWGARRDGPMLTLVEQNRFETCESGAPDGQIGVVDEARGVIEVALEGRRQVERLRHGEQALAQGA